MPPGAANVDGCGPGIQRLARFPFAFEVRLLLPTATVSLALFVLLAIWARFDSPAPWEPGVLAALAMGHDALADLTGAINTLGNLPIWSVLVVALAAVTGWLRGARAALLVLLSLASDLVALGVKILVERPRPETATVEQFFGPDSFAFPSGHVVRTVALVAALAWIFAPPRLRFQLALVGGIVAGLVMGYARVALGVHWPTDALGGILLGIGWFALTAWLLTERRASAP